MLLTACDDMHSHLYDVEHASLIEAFSGACHGQDQRAAVIYMLHFRAVFAVTQGILAHLCLDRHCRQGSNHPAVLRLGCVLAAALATPSSILIPSVTHQLQHCRS